MFNFEDLQAVKTANTRQGKTRVSYDLRLNLKTSQFYFSKDFFEKYNMKENGLTQYNDKEGNLKALSIQPEAFSRFFKGKTKDGSEKGLMFKNETLANAVKAEFGQDMKNLELTLKHEGEKDGIHYFSFHRLEKGAEQEEQVDAPAETDGLQF